MTTCPPSLPVSPQVTGLAPASSAGAALVGLGGAIQDYFDLMHDCDTRRFDAVFHTTAYLHGYRDDAMVAWSAPVYRAILEARRSPKSLGAKRADEILLIDIASPDMAFVKLRVRIAAMVFVDDLTWHRFDAGWRITSKGFHLESSAAESFDEPHDS